MYAFFIHLSLILGVLVLGKERAGSNVGLLTVALLSILAFTGQVEVREPTYVVILLMMATITATSGLERVGALQLLATWSSALLQSKRGYLTWCSALLTYGLVWVAGTSHVIYFLFPIIAEIATHYQKSLRPPLLAVVLASQQALLASPVSAIFNITISQMHFSSVGSFFALYLVATLTGTLATTAFIVWWYPADFPSERMKNASSLSVERVLANPACHKRAKWGLAIFVCGIVAILVLASMTSIPNPKIVTLVMFTVASLLFTLAGKGGLRESKLFTVGMESILVVLGVSWLANSLITTHKEVLATLLLSLHSPWVWGALFFAATIITSSQATTAQFLLPLACQSALPKPYLLALLPAINSFYVLATYPTIRVALTFDREETIHMGGGVNHDWLLPGLLGTITTCLVARLGASFL